MIAAQSKALADILGTDCFLTDSKSCLKHSQDFFWYSHILRRTLKDKVAQGVALIQNIEQLRRVIAYCHQEKMGITPRGAGTGNYGQAVPLEGGIVIDLSGLNRLKSIDAQTGVAQVEAGLRCYALENQARRVGWEMKVYPTTWVTATIGGFLAGGSVGIGSVRHGVLSQSGSVRSVTIMTIESEPRLITLEGDDILPVLHAFGTNGLIVEAEVCLAPKVSWDQIAVAADDLEALIAFAIECAADDALDKRMLSLQQWPLPGYFVQIRGQLPEGKHTLLADISSEHIEGFKAAAIANGFTTHLHIPAQEPRGNPMLSNFAQNHTTLWAQKANPNLTYCAVRFSHKHWREQLKAIRAAFGEQFYIRADLNKTAGVVGMGGGPIFPYVSDKDILEKERVLKEMGVFSYSVHDPFLDSDGRKADIEKKIAIKNVFDPDSLSNPGRICK